MRQAMGISTLAYPSLSELPWDLFFPRTVLDRVAVSQRVEPFHFRQMQGTGTKTGFFGSVLLVNAAGFVGNSDVIQRSKHRYSH